MVDELLRGHRQVFRDYARSAGKFLKKLASEGQSPDALYVGCSDSRVVPELLTASSPGRLFVVRNVANVLPPLEHADASVGAALEYGVGALEVPHIIVCGHYGCGGIEAVVDNADLSTMPSVREWLEQVRPAVERSKEDDRNEWFRRAVELNVLVQLGNITTFPMARAALEAGKLALHGWVYDLNALQLRVYDPEEDRFRRATSLMEKVTAAPDPP